MEKVQITRVKNGFVLSKVIVLCDCADYVQALLWNAKLWFLLTWNAFEFRKIKDALKSFLK
jgi:hypothetical protein